MTLSKRFIFISCIVLISISNYAQDCDFDKDQIINHKLGKTIVNWTKINGGLAFARFNDSSDSSLNESKYKYWISVSGELEGIRLNSGFGRGQIDSVEVSIACREPGRSIKLVNYDIVPLKNSTISRIATYKYTNLFDITFEQLKELSSFPKYFYSIKAYVSADGKLLSPGYFNWGMTKKDYTKTVKNINCILNLN
ncbi:MAG: hypothetical protein IPM34_05520 [Saprospiraceae bacterium]|nr:hypothetical protein [Saprospiraceae bacterium]